jgi:hypothetical protein
MHLRQQIINAVVTAVTGLTTTGADVANRRTYPQGTTPALNVYWSEDIPDYERGKLGSVPLHGIEVHVEGITLGEAETQANTIAEEVEAALYTDQTLGGLAIGIELGVATIEQDGEGADQVLVIDLMFIVFYRAAEGIPGTVA